MSKDDAMSTDDAMPITKLQFWHRKKLPMLRQSEGAECGLACLAMVAGYYGFHTTMQTLRQSFNLSLDGATLLDLTQFAEQLSLTSRPLKVPIEGLSELKRPCILHWDLNHFVVLKSVGRNSIVIHDPATGEKRLSFEEVSNHFTGIALELSPTSEFQTREKPPTLRFSDLWSKITGLGQSLVLIAILSLLLQLMTLASPYYIQLVIDDAILTADTSLLAILAVGFGLVLLFEVATSALRGFTLLHFGNLMSIQLGSNLFHHMIRLPVDYFEKRHMGDLVSRFSSLQFVKDLLTKGVIETIIDGIMALITLAMIFFYSPMLSAVVLISVLIYGLFRLAVYHPYRNISEQEIIAQAEENTNYMETLRAIQTIKLFGAEVKREGMWQNRFAAAINQNIRLGHYEISFNAVHRLLFGIENIIVIYLAATLVIDGGFSVGMLFAFVFYKNQFTDKTAKLVEKLIEFKMLGLHLDRLSDITMTEKEQIGANGFKQQTIKGTISLKNVSYRYSAATPLVIDNLSLEIKAGESVAITGPSGCGKSTLLKLMLGLIKPDSGEVLIDGQPLAQLGNRQFRQQVAAVMQNDELLSGSVANNIGFFETPLDMERIQYCARCAAIDDDISMMAMGYESLIGDMGSSLSGGQKQRLLLARALYRQPKILFMDEATSHLDSRLESNINDSIVELDMTRIIIAHRKETIASAGREIRLTRADA